MAKKTDSTGITLNEMYNEVARRADTAGTKINAAETKRVLACFFDVLGNQPTSVAFGLIGKGLKRAGRRR